MTSLHAFRALCLAALALVALPASAQLAWPSPATEAEWGLAIIDVETTGLDPSYAEMIDIGAVYTDLEGNELGSFFSQMMPPHADRADPGAVAVNGYSAERWTRMGAPSEGKAAADFIDFHQRTAGGRKFIFVAYNTPFDKGFVDAWLKRNGSSFDALYIYMPLDLPSVAWGLGLQVLGGRQLAAALGVPEETSDPLLHTGATGAEWNAMVYRALLARRKAMHGGAQGR